MIELVLAGCAFSSTHNFLHHFMAFHSVCCVLSVHFFLHSPQPFKLILGSVTYCEVSWKLSILIWLVVMIVLLNMWCRRYWFKVRYLFFSRNRCVVLLFVCVFYLSRLVSELVLYMLSFMLIATRVLLIHLLYLMHYLLFLFVLVNLPLPFCVGFPLVYIVNLCHEFVLICIFIRLFLDELLLCDVSKHVRRPHMHKFIPSRTMVA